MYRSSAAASEVPMQKRLFPGDWRPVQSERFHDSSAQFHMRGFLKPLSIYGLCVATTLYRVTAAGNTSLPMASNFCRPAWGCLGAVPVFCEIFNEGRGIDNGKEEIDALESDDEASEEDDYVAIATPTTHKGRVYVYSSVIGTY
mmetsp:Transcript_116630/g.226842  ORF Transcript_116630/g.226842 Transcript_116630/m.226842 type:complete len:144 (+) Transcript_116630:116-547(+)